MLRKSKKYRVAYVLKGRHETIEAFIRRMEKFEYKTKMRSYQRPIGLGGNFGILELFPDKPRDLVIKVEAPLDVLEEIFKVLNNIPL